MAAGGIWGQEEGASFETCQYALLLRKGCAAWVRAEQAQAHVRKGLCVQHALAVCLNPVFALQANNTNHYRGLSCWLWCLNEEHAVHKPR